jgi:hypothetical protein
MNGIKLLIFSTGDMGLFEGRRLDMVIGSLHLDSSSF